MEEKNNRAIIDVDPKWPFWQKCVAAIINALPVYVWGIATYYLLVHFEANKELASYGAAYLNLIVRGTAYSILSMVAGISLISWLNPFFSPRRLMSGDHHDKYVCAIYWAAVILGLALVISGAK